MTEFFSVWVRNSKCSPWIRIRETSDVEIAADVGYEFLKLKYEIQIRKEYVIEGCRLD